MIPIYSRDNLYATHNYIQLTQLRLKIFRLFAASAAASAGNSALNGESALETPLAASPSSSFLAAVTNAPGLGTADLCHEMGAVVHSVRHENWQLVSMTVGAVNSILNPIIYAFWYPQFRNQLSCVWKRFLRLRHTAVPQFPKTI